ncbi:hypothetical protein [Mycolicibacterium chlorophenolicum]|uniref:Uncharacterized protein n=1 Tax=Mycolicibacterium chlorophenolicum TaxID=37916 RepID=A0A0J6WKB2_9MYCO|nr:hypothetical protein [Mycolicibacterium chlorophenolicum]KMO82443.1 hypothetical protein MCHLDSM_01066 [Mycolicibacterium chlorophenolicum]
MTAPTSTVADDAQTAIVDLLGVRGVPLGTVLRELAARGFSRSSADAGVRTLIRRGVIVMTDDRHLHMPASTPAVRSESRKDRRADQLGG